MPLAGFTPEQLAQLKEMTSIAAVAIAAALIRAHVPEVHPNSQIVITIVDGKIKQIDIQDRFASAAIQQLFANLKVSEIA